MSDQESLTYSDYEDPQVMGDYSNRTQAEKGAAVNRVITRAVRNGTASRGVDDILTTQWFTHIYDHFTEAHVATLTNIEAKWTSVSMSQKLDLMQNYINVIEEVRPADSIVDESDDHSWTWTDLSRGAGSLMKLIILMIKKATGQSRPVAAIRELREKMRTVKALLADGFPVPPVYLRQQQGRNKNNLLASGVKSLQVEDPNWWESCLAGAATMSLSLPGADWTAHLDQLRVAAEWDDSLVEGDADASAVLSGRFTVDLLTNLAFFARRYHHGVDVFPCMTLYFKIIGKTGALSKANLISVSYPVLFEMSTQWVGDGNTLHMCPVVMTFRRFTLAMSLLSGYPSELTALRTITDVGSLANLIDLVFQAQGGLDSLLSSPLNTSMAEHILHRALIWGATTDPARFVRTRCNVLAIMSHIISDYNDEDEAVAGAWQKTEELMSQRRSAEF